MPQLPDQQILDEIAPTGVLRAAINLSNFLLVTGRTDAGEPDGVAPDMARAIATELGVPITFLTYPNPGELADAAITAAWDVGLIGAEPARAASIDFSAAYCEIAATFLVPSDSKLTAIEQVDKPGVRIAVAARTAYGLWLDRNITAAELVHADGLNVSFDVFLRDRLDALAGLVPRLLADCDRIPGARLLPGSFCAVQQSIGVPKGRTRAAAYMQRFVAGALSSGLVATLIEKHGVRGLSVAPSP